jgi:hypothetical protein
MIHAEHTHFDVLSEGAVKGILGIHQPVPLSHTTLSSSLRVTFLPVSSASKRLLDFVQRLRCALISSGVTVIEYEHALADAKRGKVREGIAIIATGELKPGDLPVDHVSNLRTTTLVGIVDGPCPADREGGLQEKLNSVVKSLAWSIVQAAIFVDESSWTICTMNGAIIKNYYGDSFVKDVFSTLVPKMAAPVVPPHSADFEVHEELLDLSSHELAPYVSDFTESARLWADTGLMLFHTTLNSLSFRNRFYKRLAAAYLDHRSGMSYGFLARQLSTPVMPAMTYDEAEKNLGPLNWNGEGFQWLGDRLIVGLSVNTQTMVMEVPEVRVLTTRSGCDKSNIDAHRDLVLMGLSRGRVILETPKGVSTKIDCKPSYDTVTILAHAVGNSLIAGVLSRLKPAASFAAAFRKSGMALAHWHGQLDESLLPQGYFVHGETNPPVSCSTHQAAIYALTGKMKALRKSFDQGIDFQGDAHIEPHHGVNITGQSLVALARWVLEHATTIKESLSGSETAVAPVASLR